MTLRLQVSEGQKGNYPPNSEFYAILKPQSPDHSSTHENLSATQDQEPRAPDPPENPEQIALAVIEPQDQRIQSREKYHKL